MYATAAAVVPFAAQQPGSGMPGVCFYQHCEGGSLDTVLIAYLVEYSSECSSRRFGVNFAAMHG